LTYEQLYDTDINYYGDDDKQKKRVIDIPFTALDWCFVDTLLNLNKNLKSSPLQIKNS